MFFNCLMFNCLQMCLFTIVCLIVNFKYEVLCIIYSLWSMSDCSSAVMTRWLEIEDFFYYSFYSFHLFIYYYANKRCTFLILLLHHPLTSYHSAATQLFFIYKVFSTCTSLYIILFFYLISTTIHLSLRNVRI